MKIKASKEHPLEWLLEPLEQKATYLRKKMFGCEAIYLNGRLTLVLAASDEPWNGLLVATGREHHPALLEEWKELQPHPVLGKWLYLSQNHQGFEKVAISISKSVSHGDARIGVESRPRKRKRTETSAKKNSANRR